MFGSNEFRVRASRVVRDPRGIVVWRVVEVDTTGIPGARGDACLLFDGAHAVQRVWDYPADWNGLPDAELVALSMGGVTLVGAGAGRGKRRARVRPS